MKLPPQLMMPAIVEMHRDLERGSVRLDLVLVCLLTHRFEIVVDFLELDVQRDLVCLLTRRPEVVADFLEPGLQLYVPERFYGSVLE
jgi:hypothetical protein